TIMVIGIALPFLTLGERVGLTPLPGSYFVWLLAILLSYGLLTQVVKTRYSDCRRRARRARCIDVREDVPPARPRRRAPTSHAARAARLPRRQLQRDPDTHAPGGRRRLRDHGAGRVSRHVGHQYDLRDDRAARDRHAADA